LLVCASPLGVFLGLLLGTPVWVFPRRNARSAYTALGKQLFSSSGAIKLFLRLCRSVSGVRV
jgi:hypothetical protein